MAINVNIDNQLGLVYSFRIANKMRELVFSDECALEMNRVGLKVDKITSQIESLYDDELEEKSVDEQMELIKGWYGEIRDAIIPFFDKYFGEEQGQEIYEYVHESTRALATIFSKINDYLNQVTINPNKKNVTSINKNTTV